MKAKENINFNFFHLSSFVPCHLSTPNNTSAAFVRTSHRLTEINRLLFLRTTDREKSHPEKLLLSGWT